MSNWKKITKELDRRVLVTNNINARDATGGMSHVWLGFIIKSAEPKKYGKFVTFDEADRKICDLTHYCEIPEPTKTADAIAEVVRDESTNPDAGELAGHDRQTT